MKFIYPPTKKFTASSERNENIDSVQLTLDKLPENSSKIINIDDEPVLIIRKNNLEITALSAICTHMNCIVGYNKGNSTIDCACHGGKFDINGNVISGPPKKPLIKFNVSLTNNKIIITKPGAVN